MGGRRIVGLPDSRGRPRGDVNAPLTWPEYLSAANAGCLRFANVRLRNLTGHNFKPRTWAQELADHIDGMARERAACKWAGVHWDASVGRFHSGADIGTHTDVRKATHDELLILRENDEDRHVHIAVAGEAPDYRLAGWIWGHERYALGRLDNTYRTAHFVPLTALHDMREIPWPL